MKQIIAILVLSIVVFTSCGNDDDTSQLPTTNVTFNFSHNWNGVEVTNANFNTIQYLTENNDELSIEKLRYLISKVTFQKSNGETITVDGYNLVDVTNNTGLTFIPEVELTVGTYSNVSFTFGFDNTDNIDGAYADLNTASWNVPMMMGGGYHFMQLEGKFIDNIATETGYAYHTINAVDNSDPDNLVFQDTFFTVNLGEVIIREDAGVEVKMNIAEWFKNPNTWDLNARHNMLMPNFEAQVDMYENGQSVFSLGEVTP
ncbi:MAG: MbnP family protein [Flavobacteriaceae bacterium]